MNGRLEKLQEYPFEKLAKLKAGLTPPPTFKPIVMSIGEPKHLPPDFVLQAVKDNLGSISNYPVTAGIPQLREAIAQWLTKRFFLKPDCIDAGKHILPVNGTREALFAIAQAVINTEQLDPRPPLVVLPNPFYQIYEGATILSGAEPFFLNIDPATGLPDYENVPDEIWRRCQLLYVSSPGNPTGAVLSNAAMQKLIVKALHFDFVIASDECYSELYFNEEKPPVGVLESCHRMGNDNFKNCLAFHSLSKRSSLPGMRSGFVAGDAKIIERFRLYRTYHGCAMPPPFQYASISAWQDEKHVVENRNLYRMKFKEVTEIISEALPAEIPAGAFYLWLKTPGADTDFARALFAAKNVTVLPGSYLSRSWMGQMPGQGFVRIALVPEVIDCVEAAKRIRDFVLEKK